MKLTDKFPNAHPDAVKCYEDMKAATKGIDVFFVAVVAHQITADCMAYIAKKYPEWRKELAEQLRMTADWCEFMPADAMDKTLTGDEIQALIDKHRFDAT